MKRLLLIMFLYFSFYGFGQMPEREDVVYDLILPYKPATIKLLTDTSSSAPSKVNGDQKIRYVDVKPGRYRIEISGPGQPTTVRDNIVVLKGQRLVLSFNVEGPCLFDHPTGYIPVCPKNHKDNIIPIVYGLVATNGDTFIKSNQEMKIKYAGCVTTGCDPQYYCKEHDIAF